MSETTARNAWSQVIFAILPGIWLMLQRNPGDRTNSFTIEVATLAITMVLALAIVLVSLSKHRRLEPWCLPALGAVLVKLGDAWSWLASAWHAGWLEPVSRLESFWAARSSAGLLHLTATTLVAAACLIAAFSAVLVLLWLHQIRRRISWHGWMLLGLLGAAAIAPEFFYVVTTFDALLLFALALGAFSLLYLLVPTFIGSFLARRSGLGAALFVVAFEPEWIQVFLGPTGGLRAQLEMTPLNAGRLESVLFVLSYLPILCFLIVIPLGFLRSTSRSARVSWLLIPSAITLVSINILRGMGLSGTELEYSPLEWARHSGHAILVWLPLLLASLAYEARTNKPPVLA